MTLFEQLKSIPKVDMHINLTSSISTDLAFDLSSNANMIDIMEEMREKNVLEYENALKLPTKLLNSRINITLAISELIERLKRNNVIYGELFLDLPLYNKNFDEEKILKIILDVIKEKNYNLQVVLILSSDFSKEDNLHTLEVFEKYYMKGVNGIYFYKNKMDNLSDYAYIFDRLIKNSYPYILNMNSKMTNTDYDIYMHAKRIIYALPEISDTLKDEFKMNDIMLEVSITRFKESNIIDLKNWFLYDYLKENRLFTITSCDMTTLNTDILNEWCIVFNNYPITLLDMVKVINKNLSKANINLDIKNKLIDELKNRSNEVL